MPEGNMSDEFRDSQKRDESKRNSLDFMAVRAQIKELTEQLDEILDQLDPNELDKLQKVGDAISHLNSELEKIVSKA